MPGKAPSEHWLSGVRVEVSDTDKINHHHGVELAVTGVMFSARRILTPDMARYVARRLTDAAFMIDGVESNRVKPPT